MIVKNYLLGYKQMYIYQDTDGFNFSLDSVLLAKFVSINKGTKQILDIGCGNAPIPLILSTMTDAKITGVEIQKKSFELAVASVLENNLQQQIEIINDDIRKIYKKIESDTYDIITCNPPYFKMTTKSVLNMETKKIVARHEVSLSLEDIFTISKKLLKNNGKLLIVHRPERLIEIIQLMLKNNLEPKKIRFVYPKKWMQANMVLIEASKNGKSGLKILPPLIVHDLNNNYSNEVEKLFS